MKLTGKMVYHTGDEMPGFISINENTINFTDFIDKGESTVVKYSINGKIFGRSDFSSASTTVLSWTGRRYKLTLEENKKDQLTIQICDDVLFIQCQYPQKKRGDNFPTWYFLSSMIVLDDKSQRKLRGWLNQMVVTE